jgi:hypothetical protein
MTRIAISSIAAALVLAACQSVPKADPEEIEIRDQWAAKVPPADRDRVIAEAEHHTGWGEKAKLRYEVDQFQRLVKSQDRKARSTAHKGTTHPTTHASTRMATSPHLSTTRHSTTRAATTGPATLPTDGQ